MKRTEILRTIAVCVLSAAMLSGCGNGKEKPAETTTSGSAVTTVPAQSEDEQEGPMTYATLRPLAEGDVYAINKFVVDPLPEVYHEAGRNEENQALIFLAADSQVLVRAANYKEDMQALEVFAEYASAATKYNFMYEWCDADFHEPVKSKVAGFDAIYYDYDLTQNDFIKEHEDDEGDGVKTPVDWFKSRVYYFYSDEDAYYFTFTTKADDWDRTIKDFDAFVEAISIDKNAKNAPPKEEESPAETAAQ